MWNNLSIEMKNLKLAKLNFQWFQAFEWLKIFEKVK